MPTLDNKEKAQIQKTLGKMASLSGVIPVYGVRYMTYTAASEQFHTFEAQNCIVGLSFTDCNEANEFMAKVKSMLPSPQPTNTSAAHNTLNTAATANKAGKKGSFFSRLFNKSETPLTIGMPTDFVHKQHIGYDPDKGFQSTDIPAEWASIFKNAGIRRKDLQNPEIASVIYSTLQSQLGGSAESISGQLLSIATSGPMFHGQHPASSLPHQPHSPSPPSPSVPARPTVHPLRDVAAGQTAFVPTPPTYPPSQHEADEQMSDVPPPPPPMLSSASGSSVPPPPPPAAYIPAAPEVSPAAPIPPPFAPSIPPPPPPSSASSPPSPTASPPLEHKSSSPPPVLDHLAAIKSGVTLKKVARPQADNALPDVSGLNREEATTLTSVLQNAMKARLRNIQAVEEEDEHEDDDGWD